MGCLVLKSCDHCLDPTALKTYLSAVTSVADAIPNFFVAAGGALFFDGLPRHGEDTNYGHLLED